MELQPRHIVMVVAFVAYLIMLAIFWAFDPLPQKYQLPLTIGGGFVLFLMAVYSFFKDRRH